MRTMLSALAIVATGFGLAGAAEPAADVTVRATRLVKVESASFAHELSMSARVSYAGLDLATPAGMRELQARVNDAAQSVCREIGRLYPDSWPAADGCAKQAADKAMANVKARVRAGAKKPAG